MDKQDFIDMVIKAGWDARWDAQHEGITKLFNDLFPKDAKIERLKKYIFDNEYTEGQEGN